MFSRRERDILLVVGTVIACATLYFTYKAANNSFLDMLLAGKALEPKKNIILSIPEAPKEVIEKPTEHYDFTPVSQLNSKGCLKESALKEAFLITKSMFRHDQRDLTYEKLSRHALCNNDTRFAATIAEEIFDRDDQDKAYLKIIDYLLQFQKFKEADQVAEEIFERKAKDAAKVHIISVMEKQAND